MSFLPVSQHLHSLSFLQYAIEYYSIKQDFFFFFNALHLKKSIRVSERNIPSAHLVDP